MESNPQGGPITEDRNVVLACFGNLEKAEAAIQNLLNHHVPNEAISVRALVDGDLVERNLQHESGILPGAVLGGSLGTIAGLLGAGLAAAGTVGPAAAPMAVLIAGGAGSIGGGYAGIAWWRKTAANYENDFDDESAVWVAVDHPERQEEVRTWLQESGSRLVRVVGDEVTEASKESFPASDPPSFNPGST